MSFPGRPETATIDGETYSCPFPSRPLTDEENAYLRESITEFGVRNPVLVCETPTWGKTLIQGRNRTRFGLLLGKAVPFVHLGKIDDETAKKIACDVQAAGRQLSPAEVERARRERNERIKAAADEGLSLRRIAAETGVSKSRAAEIIQTAPQVSTDRTPEPSSNGSHRQGADGKTYRQAPPAPPPAPPPDPATLARQTAEREWEQAVRQLDELANRIDAILVSPLGARLRKSAERAKVPLVTAETWAPLVKLRQVVKPPAVPAKWSSVRVASLDLKPAVQTKLALAGLKTLADLAAKLNTADTMGLLPSDYRLVRETVEAERG